MTIDRLIEILQEKKEILGGSAPVVALWDSAVTDLKKYGVANGALVFDVEMWGNSEIAFDHTAFDAEES